MWLLNTSTFKLEEFVEQVPAYAILSHRWQAGQELGFGDLDTASKTKQGWHKVRNFCEIAKENSYSYVWVDTCCIDKKSSAELSEAINSMYAWYHRAGMCCVYLADVESLAGLPRSSWWSRGWTLQELLAPSKVHFYDRAWLELGTKVSMVAEITLICSVPPAALTALRHDEYCVATKMSWASRRECTREEDAAYCLLGLLRVNMPLLYGEGAVRAFQRLQENIMSSDNDMSLFWWQGLGNPDFAPFAATPLSFADQHQDRRRAGGCFKASLSRNDRAAASFRTEVSWTADNAGIHFKNVILYPYRISKDAYRPTYALILGDRSSSVDDVVPIMLVQIYTRVSSLEESEHGWIFRRVDSENEYHSPEISWTDPRLMLPTRRLSEITITRKARSVYFAEACEMSSVQALRLNLCASPGSHCQHFVPATGYYKLRLKDWSLQNEVLIAHTGEFRWSASIKPADIRSLFTYVRFCARKRIFGDTLVCFGLNAHFAPFCIIVFYCESLLSVDLTVTELLKTYRRLGEARNHSIERRDNVVFDKTALVASLTNNSVYNLRPTQVAGVTIDVNLVDDPWQLDVTYDEAAFEQYWRSQSEHEYNHYSRDQIQLDLKVARRQVGIFRW